MTGALDVSEASLLAHTEERERDEDNFSDEDDLDDEDDDFRRRGSSSKPALTGTVNAKTQRNIRGPAKKKSGGDSDSDFEFDL